jgi:hypothetical protein
MLLRRELKTGDVATVEVDDGEVVIDIVREGAD